METRRGHMTRFAVVRNRCIMRVSRSMSWIAALSCMYLLLCAACHDDGQPYSSWSMSGNVGANGEYHFVVSAQRLKDGSIHASPILIWPRDTLWPPFSLEWKGGQWGIVGSGIQGTEHRGSAVLLYQGPGQPWRELAPKWDTHYVECSEAFPKYVQAFLEGNE